MAPFSISSSNVLSNAFHTTLRSGSHRNTITTCSDGSVDHLSSGVTEPSATDSDGIRVQSPSVVTSPPYTSSYRQPLSDKARTKKQMELFDSVIDRKLSTIPVRLIDTSSGKLCGTGELCAHFKESRNYKEVETKILRANEKEMKVAVDAFFECAMFSHRWSTTVEDEPTYDHIKGKENIYDLKSPPGIEKLQQFCKVAKENQFRWAWSDTCCIDKSNNVELQESIISMFSWYRLSSVTIVHLSDVIDEESFRNSVWFTRGWTLQELIAPRLVWFYKKDWTPYIDSKQNHKNDPHVIEIISEITSIGATDLNEFVPGLHVGSDESEVKKRMSWLASRKTAKVEDMAYCMMGIFGVHMPVMYGERENAFVRLQKEVMNLTDDLSLFDWVGKPSELHSYFASHPSCFANHRAGSESSLSKLSHPQLLQASKAFASAIGSTVVMNIKKLLLDPPHGHFIANGKMNMPLFVHEVMKLEPVDATDPPTLNDDGFIDYLVKAEGLGEVKITTHQLLPTMKNGEGLPCYRLVRTWDFNLIPSEDAVKKADEAIGSGDGDGERHEKFIYTPQWLDRSDVLSPMATAVTTAVSRNAVIMFMSRLREPFVAQLLIQRRHGGSYERVGTRERLIAAPSSGSITFRGIKILSVR
ncbi:hypothetical protein BDR03DRAFT_660306 [Suillus americanus]|nr:hypothetical protein BDR03DRAFT_660306 [Suillus americanus]